MKRKAMKLLAYFVLALLIGVPAFVMWMRLGEEAPLDYSFMDFETGPSDPTINGYTHLRQFCEENEEDFPDNYPVEYSEDYEILVDYNLYENWDLEFFKEILEANADFMAGIEAAFERPTFMADQEFSPETSMWHVSYLRSYVILRVMEARVLHLSGDSEAALARLAGLADELTIYTKSGDALIGLLTSVAMNGILTHELWVYQANIELPAQQLKSFAKDYDVAEYYSEAIKLAMRQEFHFMRNAMQDPSESGVAAHVMAFGYPPSEAELLLQRIVLYLGLRETRTLNEMFKLNSEVIRQADRPVSQRNFEYAEEIGIYAKGRDWTAYMNRNPFGHVLISSLSPSAVMNKVSTAETSVSATRMSLALQAYYLDHDLLPDSFDALVPEYLPTVPRDPFDGQPMRYSKERKIVYSVGDDYLDHGGSEKPFQFQMDYDDNEDAAEHDEAEPTYPLRFAM